VAGGGPDREQNYWPGFVDALSNVVLTLVFVLVVFVFALVITSGKLKQKSAQMVEQQIERDHSAHKRVGELETEIQIIASARDKLEADLTYARQNQEKLQEELKDVLVKNQALQAYKASIEAKERGNTPSIIERRVDLTVNEPSGAPKNNEEVPDTESGEAVVITYPRNVLALNDPAKADLGKVLDPYRGRLSGAKTVIEAHLGPETFSEGRRMAYYRALDLRNFLLERKLAVASSITITTKPNKDAGDGRIELRFVR
jgi:hypothetical protein